MDRNRIAFHSDPLPQRGEVPAFLSLKRAEDFYQEQQHIR